MPLNKLGYACVCLGINTNNSKIITSRRCQTKTFTLDKASDLILKNVNDLFAILKYNLANNIFYYRVSSDIFPLIDHPDYTYEIEALKDADKIKEVLKACGDFARTHQIRLSTHPGQYTCIASPREEVVSKSLLTLEKHSLIGDLLGCGKEFKINVHIGGHYTDKIATAKRFCEAFYRLDDKVKDRLTVENDDTDSMYSVKELYHLIYNKIYIPICFDIFHHKFHEDGLTCQQAFYMASVTWGYEIPEVHHSEAKFPGKSDHSDFINEKIPELSSDKLYDVMFEAKKKDLALLQYRDIFRPEEAGVNCKALEMSLT